VILESFPGGLLGRLRGRAAALRLLPRLARAGVTWRSLLMYPARRRLARSRSQLDVSGGGPVVASAGEPLLALFGEIWAERCYAPSRPLVPGEVIVDIGANVGIFALWAAREFPGARIVALEPAPAAFEQLQRNLSANRADDVTIAALACGGKNGRVELFSRGPSVLTTMFERDAYGSEFAESGSVEVVSLDEAFDRFDISRCRLLKLDCEGAEYEILGAAPAELLDRIDEIAMEYHVGLNDHRPEELRAILEGAGFDVVIGPLLDLESGYLRAVRREET
jgi:FkbM family methyltransferase